MNSKIVILTLCGASLLAIATALVIVRAHPAFAIAHTDSRRSFEVEGKIVAIDVSARSVRIAHDEIPDYMPAMTMPFTVRDTSLLKGLTAGDNVQVPLVVTEDDSWISRIERVKPRTSEPDSFATKAAQTARRATWTGCRSARRCPIWLCSTRMAARCISAISKGKP